MSFVLQKPCILCSVTHSQVTPLPLQDLPIFYVNASKSFSYMYHKDSASTHFVTISNWTGTFPYTAAGI